MTIPSSWQPAHLCRGASIELSADAPMREPYVCYMQGGLTYSSGKAGILLAAERIKTELHN